MTGKQSRSEIAVGLQMVDSVLLRLLHASSVLSLAIVSAVGQKDFRLPPQWFVDFLQDSPVEGLNTGYRAKAQSLMARVLSG